MQTAGIDGMLVNIAVSYGGRHELRDAVRSLLAEHARNGTSIDELAQTLDIEHIAEHLYTRGQPDPDLIIRTSGEQRLSGFLMWQSAHSEFYFCEALWPDFRKVDFIRALRSYAAARAPVRPADPRGVAGGSIVDVRSRSGDIRRVRWRTADSGRRTLRLWVAGVAARTGGAP